MVKAGLLKVYLLVTSSIGYQLACYRLIKTNSISRWWIELWTVFKRAEIHSLNVEKGQPKEDNESEIRTSGLPKERNLYGSRGIVVPGRFNTLYCTVKAMARGRVPNYNLRNYTNAAAEGCTVQSDAIKRFLNLAEYCNKNPQDIVKEPIYRLMYNPRLFEMAYDKLKSKPGNMTPGINPTTLDGLSSEVMNKIILDLKNESFKFTPGKRVQIPKANGGQRPLTVAPPRDKLVQEVMRMILEVIFEPTFSDTSHGFRSGKGCHTALREIKTKFGVATWYIEGDISKCFDSILHEKLMSIIEDKIQDRRFTRLIRKALNAGYFEFKTFKHSIIGTPQGSIISPILSNIFMDRLDKFVEQLKQQFDRELKPRLNPEWSRYQNRKNRAKDLKSKRMWHEKMLSIPSRDPKDPSFKKLVYVRYADDWIIGIRGSIADARIILDKVNLFLKSELFLTLNSEKTLITNAKSDRAMFLGTPPKAGFRCRN
jgi:group II intron reverse transcriptase/maturase